MGKVSLLYEPFGAVTNPLGNQSFYRSADTHMGKISPLYESVGARLNAPSGQNGMDNWGMKTVFLQCE